MFEGTGSRDADRPAHGRGGRQRRRLYHPRLYLLLCHRAGCDYRTYALDLLGDVLLNSTFPPEHVEREKMAILREIAAHRDLPGQRINTLLKDFAWPDHPLGGPITGRPDVVEGLTREDVIYFVHEHYLPDRMIVAATARLQRQARVQAGAGPKDDGKPPIRGTILVVDDSPTV